MRTSVLSIDLVYYAPMPESSGSRGTVSGLSDYGDLVSYPDKTPLGYLICVGTPELLVRDPRVNSGERQTRWCAVPNLGFGIRCYGRDQSGLDFGL